MAAAPEVPDPARGRQALRATSRSSSRPTASACATCSTCPAWSSCCAACTAASCRSSRSRPPTASPFASSLLFDYVATYMYEGDTPNAERRAAALSLDRDLLRELLGQEELRELIDPGALEQVEDDLQHRSTRTRATDRDALHDVLRRVGDLTRERGRASACSPASTPPRMLRELERERRAVRLRIGGEQRWIAADDAGPLPRRARRRAPGRPARRVPRRRARRAARALVARYAAHRTARSRGRAARRATASTPAPRCASSSASGELVRGELRPGAASASGATSRSCAACAALRWPRCARRSSPPTSARSPRSCRPGRASTATPRRAPAIDRLREVLVPLQGLALPAEVWERDVLPAAHRRLLADLAGQPVRERRGRLGRRRLAGPQLGPRGAVLPRGRAAIGRPAGRRRPAAAEQARRRPEPEHELIRERLAAAPCFFTDLLAELDLAPEELQEALWDLVWAGEVTNDAWAPLRAPRLTLARAQRARGRVAPGGASAGGRAARARGAGAGAGTLVADRAAVRRAAERRPRRRGGRAAHSPSCCSSATASSPASRCSPRASRAASRCSTTPSPARDARRLPPRLLRRGSRRRAVRAARRGRAPARAARRRATAPPLVLAATDPAQPYGAALPWPQRPEGDARRPARVAGAHVVLVGAEPVLYVERGGRGLLTLVTPATSGWAAPWRRWPRRAARAAWASSPSRRSTASPSSAPSWRRCCRARLPRRAAQAHAER